MPIGLKIVLVVVGVAVMVVVGLVARRYPRHRPWLLTAMAVLLFVGIADVYLVSYEEYRGTERGFGITLVDLLAIAIALAFPTPERRLPFRNVFVLLFIPCAVSVVVAIVPLYAGFGLFKLARGFFVFWAVTRACLVPEVPPALLKGLAFGLVYQGVLCLKLRYLDGVHQVAGAFPHQNSLGMAVNLVAPMMLAQALRHRQPLAVASVLAAALCVVLTLSRGSIAMFGFGMLFTLLGSIKLGGWTIRRQYGAMAAVVAAIAVLAKSGDSILRRFITAPEESAEARDTFNDAAWSMAMDHPLGVGLNNYSHALQHGGYAELVGIEGYRASGVVHHIYYLTLAETGWLGLLAYCALLLVPLIAVLRGISRGASGDIRRDVLLGAAVGLVAMYLQGLLEWIARQPQQMYLFFIVLALVGALTIQLVEQRTRAVPKGS